MKIIFLDIDGVLNHQLHYSSPEFNESKKDVDKEKQKVDYELRQFNGYSIGLLNGLTDDTGAKIVISSSWRKGRTVGELRDLFEKVGISGQVIDKTPVLNFIGVEDYHYSVPRGCEIKAWLELNKGRLGSKITEVEYVIFDDDSDMLWWQRNNYLWVDPYCGLTPNIIYKAKRILMKN